MNTRREFFKHGRTASGLSFSSQRSRSHSMPSNDQQFENGHAAEETPADENTPLVSRSAPTRSKLTTDEGPIWIRIPKNVFFTTWAVLTSSYVNVLLVCVPAGIVLGALDANPTAVFVVNFFAIVPLASLLSFATEELSVKLGETVGGLMNATFGNAVELIVSIVALRKGEIRIVQSSMLGSMLSNILLVLGCCFISSGLRRGESEFNPVVASTMSSLMAVAATSLIIPATMYQALTQSATESTTDDILLLSRGTAIIMLILYCLYLIFQLRTHSHLFDPKRQKATDGDLEQAPGAEEEDESDQEAEILGPIAATIALVLVTVLVAVCAEYLVDSIDSIVASSGISKTFIGLILLPIVGNAAEHVTAVVVAYKNKMDLAIGVAIGSSMQIALFVTPFLVILGWIIDQNMTLNFQGFETVVFFLSVLVVNYLIQDGKSNYLEGCMCLGTYIIIAIAFWVYPEDVTDMAGLFDRYFAPHP